MNKHIQIKNVDEALHRKLKVRAVASGMSLSDYLKQEMTRLADRPTTAEILKRLRELPPVEGDLKTVQYVREDRDSR